MNTDEMTTYLMSIAMSVDRYCKNLKEDTNDYSSSLGYVFRFYQDKISNISPQGIALIIVSLKGIKENDYGKYIDAFKDKVEDILKNSKIVDEQFKKMNKIKKSIK